jgi:small subunit ribosomal protein S16
MLVIRLARGGRSKYPTYRIVAAESARAATGKFIEVLGHYNPHTKELVIKKEETEKRLSHGAQPSNTVIKLLQRENVTLPAWVKLKTKTPKAQDEPAAEETVEPAEAAADAEGTEEAAPEVEEVRVAEAATENAEATEDNSTPAGKTETTEDTDAAADEAEKEAKQS